MENQVPASQVPGPQGEALPQNQPTPGPLQGQITAEQLEYMKARAKEMAIQQALLKQQAQPQAMQNIVYVRRNLTVAELLLVFALAFGVSLGIQGIWTAATTYLPRIEIKVK